MVFCDKDGCLKNSEHDKKYPEIKLHRAYCTAESIELNTNGKCGSVVLPTKDKQLTFMDYELKLDAKERKDKMSDAEKDS